MCTRKVSKEEVCNDSFLDDPGQAKVTVDKTGGSKAPISDGKKKIPKLYCQAQAKLGQMGTWSGVRGRASEVSGTVMPGDRAVG